MTDNNRDVFTDCQLMANRTGKAAYVVGPTQAKVTGVVSGGMENVRDDDAALWMLCF
jgi:hypothetical protein